MVVGVGASDRAWAGSSTDAVHTLTAKRDAEWLAQATDRVRAPASTAEAACARLGKADVALAAAAQAFDAAVLEIRRQRYVFDEAERAGTSLARLKTIDLAESGVTVYPAIDAALTTEMQAICAALPRAPGRAQRARAVAGLQALTARAASTGQAIRDAYAALPPTCVAVCLLDADGDDRVCARTAPSNPYGRYRDD